MTAAEVMDRSAALLNDKVKSLYNFTDQIPYLNTAIDELLEEMERNSISTTNKVSAVIPLAIGIDTATLPTDLIEIEDIFERDAGQSDFIPMSKVTFLPKISGSRTNFNYWSYDGGVIKFLPSDRAKEIQINYVARIQVAVSNILGTDLITIPNSMNFLSYRNAALLAEFIGGNQAKADKLNMYAGAALDRLLGIGVKSDQGIVTRRLPFRFAWKSRR
jgi:hypothetical protein